MNFIDTIKYLDTQLFLIINGKHNAFFDEVMYWASHKFFWIPLYILLLYLVYKQVGKQVWLVAIAAGLLVVLSDQISVHAFKDVFHRLRPCHNALLLDVHLLKGHCGGSYGFVSSHAANTFALAMFLFLLLKNRIKYFGLMIFSWAAFVCYSRVYSGVHYPMDVAVGGLLGMGIAVAMYKVYVLFTAKYFIEK